MTFTDFIENYKGVRRTVLAICIAWTTAGITAGIYVMLQRPLTTPEASFLLGIIGLPQIAVNWYFQTRGKQ